MNKKAENKSEDQERRSRAEKEPEIKNENNQFSVLLTARHSACINRQQARRQSLAQVTLLAGWASTAPGSDGRSLADFVQG